MIKTTREREALSRCPLFSSFDAEEFEALYQRSVPVTAERDEVLFKEGEAGSSLFVIVTGAVRIVSAAEHGGEHTLASLGPGESFGEMSLLDDKPRSATAIATRSSTLLRVDQEGLEALRDHRPAAAVKLLAAGMRLISDRLRAANARLLQLAQLGTQARDQIEEMRSQFLSLVSHELRTPLTVIKSSTQVLQRSASQGDPQQRFVDKIERHTERLRILVEDLIMLSLLEARPVIQRASRFDAVGLIEDVVARLSEAAAEKGLRLLMISRSGEGHITGDRAMLERAFHHLVDNAVKFSSSPGDVQVEAEALADGGVRVSVLDQGPGISPDARERVFQSFSQEQDPLTREVGGLGIGLTLVREVVAAHGGRLQVETELNQGSRFTIELPPGPA